jgi:biotin carboxyl carrier protein
MQVGAGVAFVECEAMKMIMQLKTTEAGVIRHNMQVAGLCVAIPRASFPRPRPNFG